MCKKQTSVTHRSTEAEIVSLDAGLRMDGIPALDLWDLVIEVFHSPPKPFQQHQRSSTSKLVAQHHIDLCNVDHVPSNAKFSRLGAMLYIFEDNDHQRQKSDNETRVRNPQGCS